MLFQLKLFNWQYIYSIDKAVNDFLFCNNIQMKEKLWMSWDLANHDEPVEQGEIKGTGIV